MKNPVEIRPRSRAHVECAAADGRPRVGVADDADHPVVDRREDAARARRTLWNQSAARRLAYICGSDSTSVTVCVISSGSTIQSMPAITRMKRMITVRIATPRFIPRRWNHRTSGSRPSVMNAAARREHDAREAERGGQGEADEHAERGDERPD